MYLTKIFKPKIMQTTPKKTKRLPIKKASVSLTGSGKTDTSHLKKDAESVDSDPVTVAVLVDRMIKIPIPAEPMPIPQEKKNLTLSNLTKRYFLAFLLCFLTFPFLKSGPITAVVSAFIEYLLPDHFTA